MGRCRPTGKAYEFIGYLEYNGTFSNRPTYSKMGLAVPTGLAKARCIDIPYPHPMVSVGLMASLLFNKATFMSYGIGVQDLVCNVCRYAGQTLNRRSRCRTPLDCRSSRR